jgi:hypothetical protein
MRYSANGLEGLRSQLAMLDVAGCPVPACILRLASPHLSLRCPTSGQMEASTAASGRVCCCHTGYSCEHPFPGHVAGAGEFQHVPPAAATVQERESYSDLLLQGPPRRGVMSS